MIPPNQGSSLSLDSSLNRKPRKKSYISGYEGPNEISQDVPEMVHILIYVVQFSNSEDETLTCGSPYKFSMLKSPKISHLGKTIISPNW